MSFGDVVVKVVDEECQVFWQPVAGDGVVFEGVELLGWLGGEFWYSLVVGVVGEECCDGVVDGFVKEVDDGGQEFRVVDERVSDIGEVVCSLE